MVDYNQLGYVTASKYRKQTVRTLTDGPQTPKEIANANEVPMSHVSRALAQLSNESLVELLVDESRKKGRLYGLTGAGEEIAEAVNNRK